MKPTSVQELLIRGIELQNSQQPDAATALFNQVLQQDPFNGPACYSLSVIALNRGQTDEAIACARRGAEGPQAFAPLHYVLGAALQASGQFDSALQSFDRALALEPNHVDVLLNSGVLLRNQFRHKEALERFQRILATDPNHLAALYNAAILLTEFKQSVQAIALFEHLIALDPDYPYALGLLLYERMHLCDWRGHEALAQSIVTGVRAGKRVCKSLAFMSISDQASDHQRAAEVFARHFCPPRPVQLSDGSPYRHARLRIAYVSPDLREHPVAHLMAGVFEQHDRARFETFAISLGKDDGSRLRARLVKAFDHFIDASALGAEQIARWMREQEIDIAIDLGGYTSDTRTDIFAYRPAPVQVNYLGYPGTMGVSYYDYIVADRQVIPPEQFACFNEKVVYLPDTYLPIDDSITLPEHTPSRADCGLPESGFVFCSFNHEYKISPQMFALWMRLLRARDASVLWLMQRGEAAQANLRRTAQEQGVDPARLIFAGRVPRVEDHLVRYRQADLFLDTYPYNGHTTAADALMSGLPVLSCMGASFPSRVAGSLLRAAGCPELATSSVQAYEDLALQLSAPGSALGAIRAALQSRRQQGRLFETRGFVHQLENTWLAMKRCNDLLGHRDEL